MTNLKKNLLLKTALITALIPMNVAVAQEAGDRVDSQDEIVVLGSRRAGRTVLDSAVPVDIISAAELLKTPSLNLKDAIAAISPSYEVARDAARDEASLVRGTSLRGLSAGQVVVLLNGKRVHRGATMKFNEQAADVSQYIPGSLKSVQVLRDGAAAQYGADAVAGVVNLILDDQEGFSVSTGYGKYYAGDGASYNVAANAGICVGANWPSEFFGALCRPSSYKQGGRSS